MDRRDNLFLSLQIRNKIYTKNGTEFQSFFENIMEKYDESFRKIRPYGKKGDKGNDGYINNTGVYYQVYAPNIPKVNEKTASKKMIEDFQKLIEGWNEISKIQSYYFVFNDHYLGSTEDLEASLKYLRTQNQGIKFDLLLATDIEKIINKLKDEDLLKLDIFLDGRKSIEIAYENLELIKSELLKENILFIDKLMENLRQIVLKLNDEELTLEYELQNCRYLRISEKVNEAKVNLRSLAKRYPKDSRPILHMADIYLADEDLDNYYKQIKIAKSINNNFWLLKYHQLVYKSRNGEKILINDLNEISIPDNQNIRAMFYCLFAQLLDISRDEINADAYMEKALKQNPDYFHCYVAKLKLLINRLIPEKKSSNMQDQSREIIDLINFIFEKFSSNGEIRTKNIVILNSLKIFVLINQDHRDECCGVINETFKLISECYFDFQIELVTIQLIQLITFPKEDFYNLLEYISKSGRNVSEKLCDELVGQFFLTNTIFDKGKVFFSGINKNQYVELINLFEKRDFEKRLCVSFSVKSITGPFRN